MACFSIGRRTMLTMLMASTVAFTVPAIAADKTHVKIGFLGPISGGNAQQGLGAKNGFMLAIEQANARPDSAYEFEPVVLDDASDPQTGVSATMKLVNDPDVAAATGFWNSPVALAAMPVFARFQTPLVVWGAISPAITDQNLPEVTRVTPTLLTENKPLAEWAVKTLGAKHIAIVADNSDFGKANADAIKKFTPEAGGEIVSTDLFPVGTTDFRTGGSNVYVSDTTIAAACRQEQLGFTQVIGKDRGRQTLRNTVLHIDRFFDCFVFHYIQDRCKGLFLYDFVMVFGFDNAWLYVATAFVTCTFQYASGYQYFTAFLFGPFDGIQVVFGCFHIDQRTYVVSRIQRVADFQLAVCFFQYGYGFVVYAFVYDQAAGRSTTLSGSAYCAKHGTHQYHVEV